VNPLSDRRFLDAQEVGDLVGGHQFVHDYVSVKCRSHRLHLPAAIQPLGLNSEKPLPPIKNPGAVNTRTPRYHRDVSACKRVIIFYNRVVTFLVADAQSVDVSCARLPFSPVCHLKSGGVKCFITMGNSVPPFRVPTARNSARSCSGNPPVPIARAAADVGAACRFSRPAAHPEGVEGALLAGAETYLSGLPVHAPEAVPADRLEDAPLAPDTSPHAERVKRAVVVVANTNPGHLAASAIEAAFANAS
jgi:hypothetical protein